MPFHSIFPVHAKFPESEIPIQIWDGEIILIYNDGLPLTLGKENASIALSLRLLNYALEHQFGDDFEFQDEATLMSKWNICGVSNSKGYVTDQYMALGVTHTGKIEMLNIFMNTGTCVANGAKLYLYPKRVYYPRRLEGQPTTTTTTTTTKANDYMTAASLSTDATESKDDLSTNQVEEDPYYLQLCPEVVYKTSQHAHSKRVGVMMNMDNMRETQVATMEQYIVARTPDRPTGKEPARCTALLTCQRSY